ncbi:MAG: ABC-F family ATP-binding cassette domain-containing protein, partial [Clostridia bacterium]|nr:ABC-F family ATP-binding cassette domain-containing protein [Clostridia bacterium]
TLFDTIMEVYADVFSMRSKLRKLEKKMSQIQGEELEQIMKSYSNITEEYERAGGFSCEGIARKIILGLGFSEPDLGRYTNSFSGGEKTRVGLARLLVRKPDVLFLDEPTNHLDIEALEWLEGYLKNYDRAVILISHDRYFLDQVTDRILELENKHMDLFVGNYTRYLYLKKEKELALRKDYGKQQKEIKKTEVYISKYKAGIKAKQARGRQLKLNRLERLAEPVHGEEINLQVGRQEVKESGNIVLKVSGLSFSYGSKIIFHRIDFEIRKNEKVVIIGSNGIGKSTLLRVVMKQIEVEEGIVELGSRVNIGYYDQEQSGLNNEWRVIDEIMYDFEITEQQARDSLAEFLFQGDDIYKNVESLSGGEKGRLSFLKMILREPNFLILDEPTNHLDIPSRTVIENYLKNFGGTILVVSHDRYFLDLISTRVLELKNHCLHDYMGNYTYYKERKAQIEAQKTEKRKDEVKKLSKKGSRNKLSTETRPKLNKAKTRAKIVCLEQEIENMEKRYEELSTVLADPLTYQKEGEIKSILEEHKALEEKIPRMYEEWEDLSMLF